MDLKSILKHMSLPEVFDDFIGGNFIIDTEGILRFWSKGAVRITGFPPEEAIGRHCSFLESSTCGAFECKKGIMNCGLYRLEEIRDVRCSFQRKDGKLIHVLRNGKVIFNRDGKPVGAIESLIDITEHLCAEKELSSLRKIVEQHTRFGKMVGKSPVMQEIYGLIEEVADSNATVLISGESGTGKE